MNERVIFDREILADGAHLIGVDEAGRGSLAGPVMVCGTKISYDFLQQITNFPKLSWVNDSKKLSLEKREAIFCYLCKLRKQGFIRFTIGLRNHGEIDKINILEATIAAMDDVIRRLISPKAKVFIDGNPLKHLQFPHFGIVKGDGKSFCIAMASIIAKVTRDRIMNFFGKKYPQYGFEKHKGYGTAAHMIAIERYGLSPIHRKTFCGKFLN
ncbi:MAG: ribonuclease HII [Puniceicoccales bacterium]|jgi:ribonuclease HII|nr:ribonuclease HII [Puniceicoccales bacterium]